MSTQTKHCSWCESESGHTSPAGTSHGICQRHKDEMIAECETLAKDVSKSFTGSEWSTYDSLPARNIYVDDYIQKTPGRAALDVLTGFVAGLAILLLAALAMWAL